MHYFLLILAQTMVGINIVANKSLILDMPIFFLLAVRFSCATLILLLANGVTESSRSSIKALKKLNAKDWYFLFAQAFAAGIFFNLLMLFGLQYTEASIAGIITSALPAMIVIMSCLFLKEKLTPIKWACVLLCTLGLLVINAVSLEVGSLEGESTLLGCLLILISLIPEAAYYILNKFHPIRLPVFLLSALMNGVNMLIMVPLAFFQLKGDFPVISLMQWMILGLLSLSSAVFYVCWYKGSEHIEASRAALSTAAMPIATLIISFIFLHEALTPMQWIGMVLIVLSIILSSKTAKKCQPPA